MAVTATVSENAGGKVKIVLAGQDSDDKLVLKQFATQTNTITDGGAPNHNITIEQV